MNIVVDIVVSTMSIGTIRPITKGIII